MLKQTSKPTLIQNNVKKICPENCYRNKKAQLNNDAVSRNSSVSYVAFRAGSVVCPQINTVAGLNTHGMKHSCELEFILIKGQPLKINIVPFQNLFLPYILYGVLYPLFISVKREMSPSDDFRVQTQKV